MKKRASKTQAVKTAVKIVGLANDYKWHMLLVAFCSMLGCAAGGIAWAPVIRWLTEKLAGSDQIKSLAMAVGGLGILMLIKIATGYTTHVWISSIVMKIRQSLSLRLFKNVSQMGFSYFDEQKVGELMTVLDGDVENVAGVLYELPVSMINIIVNLLGGFIVIGRINPYILLITTPASIVMIVWYAITLPKLQEAEGTARKAKSKSIIFLEDRLSGIRTMLSFGKETEEHNKLYSLLSDYGKCRNKRYQAKFKLTIGLDILYDITYIGVISIGGALIISGKLDIAGLLLAYSYLHYTLNPIIGLNTVLDILSVSAIGYEHIMEVLNTETDIKHYRNYKPEIDGEISFDNVTFRYKNSVDKVLEGFNLKVRKGEMLGICGSSGAGKSTLVGLISRFYDVTEGSVSIDGYNVKDFDLQYLRKQVGVVQQETYLFDGSVFDNITYSKPNASMDEVIAVAKKANAHEFISKLPDGYNTDIGERGVKLSGGQRQRLAIARLFLADPKIIILDEATSALDNESEREVQKAFEELSRDRTTLVIAHRLTTIQNADRIIYLSDQGVEEEGTHSELMAKEGKYARLYKMSKE